MKYFKVYFSNGSVTYSMANFVEDVRKKYAEFPVSKIVEIK